MKLFELFEQKNDLASAIKQHSPDNFRALISGSAPALYRGVHSRVLEEGNFNYDIVKERTQPRESMTRSNLFLDFTSESKSWKSLGVDRAFSTFVTVNVENAEIFGDPFLIIPFDNVSTFASTRADFNLVTFGKNKNSISQISRTIGFVCTTVIQFGQKSGFFNKVLPKDFINVIKNGFITKFRNIKHFTQDDIKKLSDSLGALKSLPFDLEIEKLKSSGSQELAIIHLEDLQSQLFTLDKMLSGKSLNDWLQFNMSPKAVGVKVFEHYQDIIVSKNAELWFRGQYIMINHESIKIEKLYSSKEFENLMQV